MSAFRSGAGALSRCSSEISNDPAAVEDENCAACAEVGAPHGSDGECVGGLRARVEQLNALVEALLDRSDRGRRALVANAPERWQDDPDAGE